MSEPEHLLVLRFRDLNVEPGETITRHRREIAEHDQCWWGWWARRQESSAKRVLDGLTYPRNVALYDTDLGKVYRAVAVEARTSETEALSPRVDWTPTYYNSRRLRAWFRFRDIEDWNPEILLNRVCLLTTSSGVETGWTVSSLEELRRCETTMWLLSTVSGNSPSLGGNS